MAVGGDSRDRALELARRMEESHRFAQTQVTSENFQQNNNNGDNELFDMEAIYIPERRTEAAASKTDVKSKDVKSKTEVNLKPKPPAASNERKP
jgi:hypothetical protein